MQELFDHIGVLIRARYPLLYLLTYEEGRVERNVERMAGRSQMAVWRWRSTEGLRQGTEPALPDTQPALAALDAIAQQREAAVFLMMDLHHALADPQVVRRLRDLIPGLGQRGQAVIIASPMLAVPRELEKDLLILDMPLPDRDEVARLLSALLRRQKQPITPELFERIVRTSLGLTEREIKRSYARIVLDHGEFGEDCVADLVAAKRQAIRRSRFLEFYDQVDDMGAVGGLENLKDWLDRRAVAFSEKAHAFGLPEPKGVFLLGVQGCGKSLTAKCVAGLFRIPLLRLDVGALFQRSGGGVEESLRETIRIAESIAPAVLWIDELEKGFLTEGEKASGSAFGTFLTWLQEKTRPVFVVATANEVRGLPPELLRKGRFDEIFFVDLPTVHERLTILEIHLRRRGRDPADFDLYQCAEETEKYSGAELEQVVVEALFNAFAEDRELNHRDLLRVIRDTVPLAITMDDRLKELREWARPRTRPASLDTRRIDYFEDFQEG
ncbi:MAG: AAA family ATPase [Alphaproteobacteria bacterium]|nr:AAA family ATPase [Alphaproteobacteria bacterium]